MSGSASSAADEKEVPVAMDMEAELTELVNQNVSGAQQLENDAERIRSSVARLTSTSIEGLEGLASELQDLQRFLNSEVRRVQGEIESALAGMKIIIETIAPWKNTAPSTSAMNARAYRAGPAAGIDVAPVRRAAAG